MASSSNGARWGPSLFVDFPAFEPFFAAAPAAAPPAAIERESLSGSSSEGSVSPQASRMMRRGSY